MYEQPPESLESARTDSTSDDDGIAHTPYTEPDPKTEQWPTHWKPRQKQNWMAHCQAVYNKLKTELGRVWYRRCFRPKQRHSGVTNRDHVEKGTPEMYVCVHIDALFNGTGVVQLAVIHRTAVKRQSVSVDTLEHVIADITQARVATLDEDERASLPERTTSLADRASENTPTAVTLH